LHPQRLSHVSFATGAAESPSFQQRQGEVRLGLSEYKVRKADEQLLGKRSSRQSQGCFSYIRWEVASGKPCTLSLPIYQDCLLLLYIQRGSLYRECSSP